MNVAQLLMQVLPAAVPFDATPTEQYLIPTASDGWLFLNQYITRELGLKHLGISTSGYTRNKLIELQALIPTELENTVVSADQKRALVDLAATQWMLAYDVQIPEIMLAYDTLLDELLEQATFIRFVL